VGHIIFSFSFDRSIIKIKTETSCWGLLAQALDGRGLR